MYIQTENLDMLPTIDTKVCEIRYLIERDIPTYPAIRQVIIDTHSQYLHSPYICKKAFIIRRYKYLLSQLKRTGNIDFDQYVLNHKNYLEKLAVLENTSCFSPRSAEDVRPIVHKNNPILNSFINEYLIELEILILDLETD